MSYAQDRNIVWHPHHVTRADRRRRHGHHSAVLWFTGLSGAGKSTVANLVDWTLARRGIESYVLDGDNIRHGLNANLGFSAADRHENIRRVGEIAKLFVDAGVFAIAAFISPYRADRDRVRALLGADEFIEIHVDAALEICEERDPKGLYKKARAGEIKGFTGIDDPYEPPRAAEIVLDANRRDPDALAAEVVAYLESRGFLARP